MEALTTIQLQNQQKDYSLLIKALVERFKPEKIYCFGKNTVFNAKKAIALWKMIQKPNAIIFCYW
ncbi:hypothetical protein [Pedobacter metabolipauper]|uniref:Uncharacterized protein n=1 Tax=Pedobacter metabolipauper TaxID=425513 RepID=A0A4R6SQ08_9SPHI|nr:hypothetical protein [Pedobacter metabolipauper]TDQ06249.1 hypothetical protein ATK78_4630 [Pedobacter metabolipauper]